MDPVTSGNLEDRGASNDDTEAANTALHESPKILNMKKKELHPDAEENNSKVSTDARSKSQNALELKSVYGHKQESKPMPASESLTSCSSPELENNLAYYLSNVEQNTDPEHVTANNEPDCFGDVASQRRADDEEASSSLATPSDKDKNYGRSPGGRRRHGTANLPKLTMPSSQGGVDVSLPLERTHDTIDEQPSSGGSPETVAVSPGADSVFTNDPSVSETTPASTGSPNEAPERKISPTKRFVTTPVSDVESNPFLDNINNSSGELSSSPQPSPGIRGFDRPRTFSASTPVAKKRIHKRSADNSNMNSKPSTPQSLRKDRKYEDFVSDSLSKSPNSNIIKNRLLDQVRRKNFSTNTAPYPPKRKTSTDSVGSQQSLTRKLSEQDSPKESSSPRWQKRLSQLFIPPSLEELNKRPEEVCKQSADDSGPPSAVQSRQGSRRGSKSADSVTKLFCKLRGKRRSVTKALQDGDDQDRLEMLDKLEDTGGLSDGDSRNNDDDDSSSDYTDDETRGMVGRRSESYPLVKSEKVQPSIMKKEGLGEVSYDDTICSNRSSYFKHFYNMRPELPQSRSMQPRVMWHHTSIASLIREKQRPDEFEKSKKKKPPMDYPQMALSVFLFLVICVMVSLIFYFYKLHIMSVFIFNRIKIVEKSRNLEVLNINEDDSTITPLVAVRLGVGFPLNARHTDCTQYLKYLYDIREDVNKYKLARKRRSIEQMGNVTELASTSVTSGSFSFAPASPGQVANQTSKVKRRKNGKSRLASNEQNSTIDTEMSSIDPEDTNPGGKTKERQPSANGKNKNKNKNGTRSKSLEDRNSGETKTKGLPSEMEILPGLSAEDKTRSQSVPAENLLKITTEKQPETKIFGEERSSNSQENSTDVVPNKLVDSSNTGEMKTAAAAASDKSENTPDMPENNGGNYDKIQPTVTQGSSDDLLQNVTPIPEPLSTTVPSTPKTVFKSTTQRKTNGRRRYSEMRDSETHHGLVDKIIHGESPYMNGFIDSRTEEPVKSTVNPRFLLPKRRKIWRTPETGAALEVPVGGTDPVEPISVEDFDSFEAAVSDRVEIADELSDMQCIDYKGNGRLQLTQRPRIGEVDCFSVHWESSSPNVQMMDCIIMDNNATGTWWGMGDVTGGSLPISRFGKMDNTPLYSGEIQRHILGGLIRRVWISSGGILVSVPLASKTVFSVNALKKNESEFCLASEKSIDVNNPNEPYFPVLDYTICTGPNVSSLLSSLREVERMNELEFLPSRWHKSQSIDLSTSPPDASPEITEDLVKEVQERFNCPVWRPWLSHDEGAIDQDDVVAYAEEIAASSFDVCGHVLLPLTWQNILGDLDFDLRRFPNPKLMLETLLRKGLRVALSLSPLIDTETTRFKNSTVTELLVRQVNSTLPILVSTTKSTLAGVLDFTNPNTIEWYSSELKKLQDKYGIDRFHVSPITTQSLPPFRQHYISHQNPDYALGQFIKAVAQIRAPISTDVAIIPVNTPTFLVAGYGDASWEMLEMLPNRILSISSVGGTLVDSGVVGGWSNQKGHIPTRELYIRWMEVSTFFPAMQLSVLPRMYDAMVETHANNLLSLRKQFVIPRFNQNLPESLTNGYPLVTPFAIAFPKDAKSLTVGDQWMVGKDMMVAPVLRRGRRARDIYLPPGIWKDGIDDRLLKGKRWLKNYVVPLGKVPYFFLMIPERGNKGSKRNENKQKRPRYH